MEIEGKTALVAGGASGMGEAAARAYIARGARVALLDRDVPRGRALATELGSRAIFHEADVSDEVSVQKAVARTAAHFGALHICNNFAGIAEAGKTLSRNGPLSLDDYMRVLRVNLVGTFNVCRLAAEHMARNTPYDTLGSRGVIINTASVAAFEGQVGQVAYSASKGGVVAMTLPMARDLAGHGIRVNAIAPGLVRTPLCDGMPQRLYESLTGSIVHPKRMGEADEVAHLCVMIAENEFINGECIRIDGGARLQPR